LNSDDDTILGDLNLAQSRLFQMRISIWRIFTNAPILTCDYVRRSFSTLASTQADTRAALDAARDWILRAEAWTIGASPDDPRTEPAKRMIAAAAEIRRQTLRELALFKDWRGRLERAFADGCAYDMSLNYEALVQAQNAIYERRRTAHRAGHVAFEDYQRAKQSLTR
ncbi:MAG: hypothetical protein AAF360_15205, partial [Pseudomonadota bacterium]